MPADINKLVKFKARKDRALAFPRSQQYFTYGDLEDPLIVWNKLSSQNSQANKLQLRKKLILNEGSSVYKSTLDH